jgi:hypothetical protein
VKGDCVVDGDCPSGYCSPSTNDDCNAPRLVGFFCRTADDECVEDGDCTGPSGPGRCVFRAQRGRWACWYATTEICGIS